MMCVLSLRASASLAFPAIDVLTVPLNRVHVTAKKICGVSRPKVVRARGVVIFSSARPISLTPALPQILGQGEALDITATVSNDRGKKGVTWSLSPSVGSLSNQTQTSVVYQAPDSVTTNLILTITATSVANSSETTPLVIMLLAPGQQNVQPVSVNGGPVSGQPYLNGPFTTVLVCEPGTSSCQAIDGILVDTGSPGLRIFKSVLSIELPQVTQSGGSVNDCVAFVGQQFLWGTVASADVYLAGEGASGISVQLVADPTSYSIPTACSNGGIDADSQQIFPANGILGIGIEPTDCTSSGSNPCDPSSGTNPHPPYFVCFDGQGCAPTLLPKSQQVTNPVVAFSRDNNGDILEFPAVGTALPMVTGTITFGINTQPDNNIGSAMVFAIDAQSFFTTVFDDQPLTKSFIDSGSNELFFPNLTGIQVCSDGSSYCPTNPPIMLSGTNDGVNNVGSSSVNFQVDNYETDITNNPTDSAFGNIAAGANQSTPCQNGKGECSFDWGLPFFFGRRVFTSIDTQTVANEPKTPWWAY
jgi:hypothetical protein